MNNTPRIVGLTGLKRSGKTTVATLMLGYTRMSFAAPLKNMLRAMGVTDDELEDKETVLPRFGQSPRFMLQTLGTEWGRDKIKQTLWVDIARHSAEMGRSSGALIVFDDVRFDNEANMILEMGGEVWKVFGGKSAEVDDHITEAGVSRHLVDRRIYNYGNLIQLEVAVDTVLGLSAKKEAV